MITAPVTGPAVSSGGGAAGPRFYLGVPKPSWVTRTSVPLLLARPRLARIAKLRPARGPWALDSGGFSQLSLHGRWTLSAAQYATQLHRFVDQVGPPDWIAQQDWMNEPGIRAKTGLTVLEHQRRTVANLVELRTLLPGMPVIPVVQGWTVGEYLHCVDLFAQAGVDLTREPVVGVGSICRRQSTIRISILLEELHRAGIHGMHGFGLKRDGLRDNAHLLGSADSAAWSYAARATHEHCPEGKRDCRNCLHYALEWRDETINRIPAASRHDDHTPGRVVASAPVQPPDPDPVRVPGPPLTRDDLAARLGVSAATVYRWQASDLQFPASDSTGRWNPEPVEHWYARHMQTKRAKLRPVDRDGNPDELLDATQVGRVLGYRGKDPGATIRSYRQPRHGNYFPDPDGTLTAANGHQVHAWRRDTIWAFADSREHHGGGTPGRSGRPRSTAAPYSTDPALPTVQALLKATPHITGPAVADATGLPVAKAYRLLKAAKTLPPPTPDPGGS